MVPGLFEGGKYFTLNSSSPYIGDGDAVLVGMPRLRQLRVKEGILKKLYQRRPNKNAACVDCVDETDLMVSCKRSVNIPRSKVLSGVKTPLNRPLKGSSHKGWSIGMIVVTETTLRLTLRVSHCKIYEFDLINCSINKKKEKIALH